MAITLAKLNGWSNGTLGLVLLGVYMLGVTVLTLLKDYGADRRE